MFTVRRARPEDGPAFVGLVKALSEFEKLPGPDEGAAARLLEDAFGERPRFELLVVEEGAQEGAEERGELLAYAVSFLTYSTFLARPTLFLEDLFVHPRARRRGIARALMDRLAERARELGCGRFEWMVLDWNSNAQSFYDGLGAERMETWRLYRIKV